MTTENRAVWPVTPAQDADAPDRVPMDGWMDGWMDEWMNGSASGRAPTVMFPPHNEVPPIRRSPKAMAMAVPPWLGSSLLVYVGVGLARQRWGGTEGHLLLDDECLSSTTERSGDPSAEPLPWSTVTDLRVRPLLLWGRCQQGHITAWRRGGQPLHLLVERPE